ncbi:MAG: hypothetical protein U9R66_09865 [Thermodesulfobacteriota bacterium]|nr:hypothetical protein [Thermodesulfobacteriota bacterium]
MNAYDRVVSNHGVKWPNVLELEGKIYATEIKSGRKRTDRGLKKFISRYPGTISVFLDMEQGIKLLEEESVDDIVRSF